MNKSIYCYTHSGQILQLRFFYVVILEKKAEITPPPLQQTSNGVNSVINALEHVQLVDYILCPSNQKLPDLDELSVDVAKLPAIIAEPLTQVSYINTITLYIFLLE